MFTLVQNYKNHHARTHNTSQYGDRRAVSQ